MASAKVLPSARWGSGLLLSLLLVPTTQTHASMFKGEALDNMANVLAWVVLIVAPVVGIAVFWIVHILPEKVAERRQHPQAGAIQCLCLVSLVFGGILWPLAWLWAYSKPVLYQMAYGTDKVAHGHGSESASAAQASKAEELKHLRQRVTELETQLAAESAPQGEKA